MNLIRIFWKATTNGPFIQRLEFKRNSTEMERRLIKNRNKKGAIFIFCLSRWAQKERKKLPFSLTVLRLLSSWRKLRAPVHVCERVSHRPFTNPFSGKSSQRIRNYGRRLNLMSNMNKIRNGEFIKNNVFAAAALKWLTISIRPQINKRKSALDKDNWIWVLPRGFKCFFSSSLAKTEARKTQKYI